MGKQLPKIQYPETKCELKEFSAKIASECAIPEINFNEEGTADHVKTFSSEQRRYRKNKSSSCKVCVYFDMTLSKCFKISLGKKFS